MFGKYKKLYEQTLAERDAAIGKANALTVKLAESEEKRKATAGTVADLEAELGRFQAAASESQKKAVDKKRTAAKGEKGK
jgi:hypothetical protein